MLIILTSFIFTTLNLGILLFQVFLKISKFQTAYLKEFIGFTFLMFLYNSIFLIGEKFNNVLWAIASHWILIAMFLYPILIVFFQLHKSRYIRFGSFKVFIIALLVLGTTFLGGFILDVNNITVYSFPIATILIGLIILSLKVENATNSKNLMMWSLIAIVLLNVSALAIYFLSVEHFGLILLNAIFLFVVFVLFKDYVQSLIKLQTSFPNGSTKLFEELHRYGLTPREMEIAQLILQDETYQEIADKFSITNKTVGKHASNIFTKVGVHKKIDFKAKFGNR